MGVHGPRVAIRRVPSLSAAIVGSRSKGDVVKGEVSSGWLRLSDGSGWMLLDGRRLGFGALLAPLSKKAPSKENVPTPMKAHPNVNGFSTPSSVAAKSPGPRVSPFAEAKHHRETEP